MQKFIYPKILDEISEIFKTLDWSLFIVWGYCRDYFLWMKNDISDIDLATDILPVEVEELFPKSKIIWKKYWTIQIFYKGYSFEVTTFREDIGILDNRHPVEVVFTKNITKDAKRRDFTMNAIYYDISKKEWIDPINGISDLNKWIIRFIENPIDRIKEDWLRILRYVRLKYRYNLKDEDISIYDILKKHIKLLQYISEERIKSEFQLIVWNKNHSSIEFLNEIWFFKCLLWVKLSHNNLQIIRNYKEEYLAILVWYMLYAMTYWEKLELLLNKDQLYILTSIYKNNSFLFNYDLATSQDKYKLLTSKNIKYIIDIFKFYLSNDLFSMLSVDYERLCKLKFSNKLKKWNDIKNEFCINESKELWKLLIQENSKILFP